MNFTLYTKNLLALTSFWKTSLRIIFLQKSSADYTRVVNCKISIIWRGETGGNVM
jgi:hypothetical protein